MATIILDNGADTIKVGYAGHTDPVKYGFYFFVIKFRIIPNCIFKPKREKKYFIADQVNEIIDNISLQQKRPHEKEYFIIFEFIFICRDILLTLKLKKKFGIEFLAKEI